MSPPKVKNLIILILVLVNVFLLALVLPSRLEDLQRQQQARQSLSELYRQAGISLDPQAIPRTATLCPTDLFARRDPSAAMAVLLGADAEASPEEGGLRFTSPLGTALILPDGTFSAAFSEVPPVGDPRGYVRQLLTDMGVPKVRTETVADGSVLTVTAYAAVRRMPVFSPAVSFTFAQNRLATAEGTLLVGYDPLESSADTCISAADALSVFLRSRMALGWVGSTVESVSQGFTALRDPVQELWHLQPVWLICTDSGDYFVDGITAGVTFCQP